MAQIYHREKFLSKLLVRVCEGGEQSVLSENSWRRLFREVVTVDGITQLYDVNQLMGPIKSRLHRTYLLEAWEYVGLVVARSTIQRHFLAVALQAGEPYVFWT
jgi:hypothetical protein